jgi:hypothetical protein
MLKLNQHTDLIWSITSEKKEVIARTFIRFQEFYENPVFKGKKGFTVADIEQWWTKKCEDEKEAEDYYSYWSGFNIPGWVIFEFLKTKSFHPLTELEQEMIDLLEVIPAKDLANGIILGVGDDTDDVFDHEFAHGLYSTNKAYNHRQLDNLWDLEKYHPKVYAKFKQELLDLGYHESVIQDEIHAYCSTYVWYLTKEYSEIFGSDVDKITSGFVRTFEFYKSQNVPTLLKESLANRVSLADRVRAIFPTLLKYLKRWFVRN